MLAIKLSEIELSQDQSMDFVLSFSSVIKHNQNKWTFCEVNYIYWTIRTKLIWLTYWTWIGLNYVQLTICSITQVGKYWGRISQVRNVDEFCWFLRYHMVDQEDGEEFILDIVNEIVESTMQVLHDQYIVSQTLPYTIQETKNLLLQIIEVCVMNRPLSYEKFCYHYFFWGM